MKFEQGPIRPPSEAESLLLRFTRNCPWNKCLFCTSYKGETFSRRTVAEIKQDVDSVARIMGMLGEMSARLGYSGEVNSRVLSEAYRTGDYHVIHVASWMYRGGRNVFIQDANSLVMKTSELVELLEYIRYMLPAVRRITSYARSKTLLRKSGEDLAALCRAGLNRIHVGMESGSDEVLKFMNKGVSASEQVEAGRRVVEAGISLSEYVILGLGGRLWHDEHHLETARALSLINPDFIRLRTLAVPPGTGLYDRLLAGDFAEQTEDSIVAGERLLIENLQGITSRVVSDHMLNLLEEVDGLLPEDKEYMLSVIDRYLSLPEADRINFRLGRRSGLYRRLDDMSDPARHARVEAMAASLNSEGKLDGTLSSIRADMI